MSETPCSVVLLTFLIVIERSHSCPEHPVTSSGTLTGLVQQTKYGDVRQFLGVRYGMSPEGMFRFQPPRPYRNTGYVQTTHYGASCQQPPHLTELMYTQLTKQEGNIPVSEDCLFLNVFAPLDNYNTTRAVMVWIPGEGFGFASSAQFDGTLLAIRGDVIVVTLNYRVGVFGFLSTGNDSAPGNQGLWDIIEGLRWVRRNAKSIGADPDRVTLFGRFTGAIAASLLLGSPQLAAETLFARLILQSGVAAPSYILDPKPAVRTQTLARLVGCEGSHEKMMRCLRGISADRLDRLSWQVADLWRPVIDGILVTSDAVRAARRGEYQLNLTVMIGETAGEGSLCLLHHYFLESLIAPSITANNLTRQQFVQLIQEHVYDYFKVRDSSVIEAAVHEYGPWTGNHTYRDKFLQFCGTVYIRIRSEQLARWLAKRGTAVWRYEFDHRPSNSHHPKFMGTAHGDDIPFVFGLWEQQNSITQDELALEKNMIIAWSNFAKRGNPNIVGSTAWPQYTENKHYMFVFSTEPHIKTSDFLSRDIDFWSVLVPSLMRHTRKMILGNSTTSVSCQHDLVGLLLGLLVLSVVLAISLLILVRQPSCITKYKNTVRLITSRRGGRQ